MVHVRESYPMQVYQQGGPGVRDCNPAKQDAWFGAWEDRLKLREAALEGAGVAIQKSRATPILNLTCLTCRRHVSWQAMQMYSTDLRPNCIVETRCDLDHGLCGCRIREFECE